MRISYTKSGVALVPINGRPWVMNPWSTPTVNRSYAKDLYDSLVGFPSANLYRKDPKGFVSLLVETMGLVPVKVPGPFPCTMQNEDSTIEWLSLEPGHFSPMCLWTGLEGWFIGITIEDFLVFQDRRGEPPWPMSEVWRRSTE